MRRATIACCTLLAACGGPRAERDYTTPERAAWSFVEAGRIGDLDGVREALVAAERGQDVHCDYSDLGAYELVRDRELDEDHVVVVLQTGRVRVPLACVSEGGRWGVSIHASLALLRQMLDDEVAPAPR